MDRTKRENFVIAFTTNDGVSINRYCNACEDYNLDIHGTCPGRIEDNSVCNAHGGLYNINFDNTKHIPFAIYGIPCKGREMNCNKNCHGCVIIKRHFVTMPEEQ